MEIRILKIVPKAFATNFNLPGKEFPTVGALAPEMPDGFVQLLLPRSRQEAGRVQARHRRSTCSPSRARSRSASIPRSPCRARAAADQGRRWRRSQHAAAVEERLQHGHQRAAGRLDASPSRSSSRAASCGRATRTAARATARSTSPRSSARTARSCMQPIVRKDMKLDWPRIETPTHWIMTGLRRGPEQGDGQSRCARRWTSSPPRRWCR